MNSEVMREVKMSSLVWKEDGVARTGVKKSKKVLPFIEREKTENHKVEGCVLLY